MNMVLFAGERWLKYAFFSYIDPRQKNTRRAAKISVPMPPFSSVLLAMRHNSLWCIAKDLYLTSPQLMKMWD
ncbi:MAG: hypothetical protein COA36_14835 [Desulfotalea sp.]|nr:MAG: hypothetical protein COA36_14835 [Desulfotalea sp.]